MELTAAVAELMRVVAADIIVPLFGSDAARPREKRPDDWVTDADHASEERLSRELPRLLPGSVVVGEESVHADPAVMDRLDGDGDVWLIDPLDGTRNYAAGREPFAMIVALIRGGRASNGWILLPMEGRMLIADAAGAAMDGAGHAAPATAPPLLRGIVPMPVIAPAAAADIEQRCQGAAEILPSWWCSGREYPDVVTGAADFAVFATSMPWDHAAGALAVAAMGGRAAYFDGTDYSVRDRERRPLLIARSPDIWQRAAQELLPALDDDPRSVWLRR